MTNRLVYVFTIIVDHESQLKRDKGQAGKLWTIQQIEQNIGQNYFCHCFEDEYNRVFSMIDECGGDREAAEEMFHEMIPAEERMFVLSKKDELNGTTILLDNNMMERVIEKVGIDFYILPSSVHEVIIVPAYVEMDINDLESMVREINITQVDVPDRLSDHVYRYIAGTGIVKA